MKIKLKLVNGGTPPKYQTPGSACLDCYSNEDVTIYHGETKLIPLGFSVELPQDYELQIRNRSGLGSKGLVFPLGVGTVDSDYRGEVKFTLYNTKEEPFHIKKGDRVCQCAIQKITSIEWDEVEELTATERGVGGFGSTGV